jgi:hypothetical protein
MCAEITACCLAVQWLSHKVPSQMGRDTRYTTQVKKMSRGIERA